VATTTSGLSSSIGSLSSSIATTTLGTKNRVDSIEAKTGSYATTGSNIFQGNQTITGSLYISQDLIVAGSSSIQNISSSILNIADNIITVNALNPSVRFGGLAVIDSGSSPQVSGSILFDSVNDQWIFIHQNQSSVTSSILLMGPQTFNNIGNEAFPTNNRLLKSVNAEHLGDSNISDNGTTVTILSNTIINGTISATGTTIVSGSAQILHDSTSGYTANRHIDHTAVSISAGNGLSGGGDISTTRTLTLDTGSVHFLDGVKKELNTEGVISGSSQILVGTTIHSGSFFNGISVVSGSAQVSFNGITDKPTLVSGSSQVSFNGITDKPTLVSGSSQISYTGLSNIPSGIVSSSAQTIANLPSGTVSGSAQVLNGTTIHSGSFFNGISVVSGSAQISFNGIIDKPTLVSGSSQITYGSISSIPSGIVSGSGQIDLTATTNYASGILTRLNAVGVFSGSAQVDLTATTNYASGILTRLNAVGVFSGSAQVTLSSTTGYGSVINQAVLTTSSPTFSTVNAATFSDGYINYTLAQINRTGGFVELQYASGGGVKMFGGGATPITFATTGGATFSGAISASNFSGTSSGTNTGDQTLNSLGALSNNTDSEQTIGGKVYYFNSGAGRMNADPRWNESGYDADLGCLHLWSWTAAGVAYGRAGIAFYNDNAYQYLTTKSNTTGLFVNNSLVLTAGNYTSYAMAGAGFSANQNLNTGSGVRFTSLGVGGANTTASHVNINGGNYNQFNLTYASSGWGLLMGYGDGSLSTGYHGLNHAAIINIQNGPIHFGTNNSSNVQVSTGGHLHPSANNTYDCGTASLAWRNVYTNDLHLSNMGKPEGNDVDGTNGNWTIQEGAEQLYIINNNNGKKFKIDLTEII